MWSSVRTVLQSLPISVIMFLVFVDFLLDNLKESDSCKEFVDVMERHEPEQYCFIVIIARW